MLSATIEATIKQLKDYDMITQNPIIGKARKKLAGIYARTLYGKNIIQTCPPSKKGKLAKSQIESANGFKGVTLMSAQLSTTTLNEIFYAPPTGRNRRQQWCKDLMTGRFKSNGKWLFDPGLITKLGGNPKVSETAINMIIQSNHIEIPLANFSAVNSAITTMPPCIILICVEEKICISLESFTTIVGTNVVIDNLSLTLQGKECWLFPLWTVNIGTIQNPIYCYGRYEK